MGIWRLFELRRAPDATMRALADELRAALVPAARAARRPPAGAPHVNALGGGGPRHTLLIQRSRTRVLVGDQV